MRKDDNGSMIPTDQERNVLRDEKHSPSWLDITSEWMQQFYYW